MEMMIKVLTETGMEIEWVIEFLDAMDGYGLVVTDDDLLKDRLLELGIHGTSLRNDDDKIENDCDDCNYKCKTAIRICNQE